MNHVFILYVESLFGFLICARQKIDVAFASGIHVVIDSIANSCCLKSGIDGICTIYYSSRSVHYIDED